jgi:hypothetical protein
MTSFFHCRGEYQKRQLLFEGQVAGQVTSVGLEVVVSVGVVITQKHTFSMRIQLQSIFIALRSDVESYLNPASSILCQSLLTS